MVFHDNIAALRYAAILGALATAVFILGITTTRWEESK
jgi:hypothetical protein